MGTCAILSFLNLKAAIAPISTTEMNKLVDAPNLVSKKNKECPLLIVMPIGADTPVENTDL